VSKQPKYVSSLRRASPFSFLAPLRLAATQKRPNRLVRAFRANSHPWFCRYNLRTLQSSRHTPCAVALRARTAPYRSADLSAGRQIGGCAYYFARD
jgi:hypothetical protein